MLTSGGTNFWYKAKDYNETKWLEYCRFMDSSEGGNADCTHNSNSNDDNKTGTAGDDGKTFEKTVFSMLEAQAIVQAGNGDTVAAHHNFTGEIGICREWNE